MPSPLRHSAPWILIFLWLIPAIPLLAAGIGALLTRQQRRLAAGLAIAAIGCSFVLSMVAFTVVLGRPERMFVNFPWLQFGSEWLKLGWMLDPLGAVMLVMVTLVSLLVFVYSAAYMHQDDNFTRFFCFLSLFASAMLGLLIANSLLLLFMCWEIVGVTSYLLIGFWFQRPAAAAAAKKAFLTTRIGDLGLLLGMVWLYAQTGTLLFYDHGAGCMEPAALALMTTHVVGWSMTASTCIALLIFCGAVGKSGQLPLHVWLPDAMEGPTPVSALIHAATMVAAGVYLVARVYPLFAATGITDTSTALHVVTWVGASTAIFAALMAVAQDDIKRILAYSTISQLGYMMIGLGVGGVATGVFHLVAHALFKALLFLGAGSVIHGCMSEQDIRKMGGLRKWMPVTFATYAVGTLALCGFPLFFSGFWSKDAILHDAYGWSISRVPFYLGLLGAVLTAFYMTRQVCYVFFGVRRRGAVPDPIPPSEAAVSDPLEAAHESPGAHENRTMTGPLVLLALLTMLLGLIATPAWPWLQAFLELRPAALDVSQLTHGAIPALMLVSSLLVFAGLGLGWWMYGRNPIASSADADVPDPLEKLQPNAFRALQQGLYVNQLYALTVQRAAWWLAIGANWVDRRVWSGIPAAVPALTRGLGWMTLWLDRRVLNRGFEEGCQGAAGGGRLLARSQKETIQHFLRWIGAAVAALAFLMLLGYRER